MKTQRILRRARPRPVRGVVAVELALILSAMLFLLPAIVLFGRVIWQYNVLKIATNNAARYMAQLPLSEIYAGTHEQVAKNMVVDAVVASGMTSDPSKVFVSVDCAPFLVCSIAQPDLVRVTGSFLMVDAVFPGFNKKWLYANNRWPLQAVSTVGYPN